VFRLEKRRLLPLAEPVFARHTPESIARRFQYGVRFGGIQIWKFSADVLLRSQTTKSEKAKILHEVSI
jgi:hypothetical protein